MKYFILLLMSLFWSCNQVEDTLAESTITQTETYVPDAPLVGVTVVDEHEFYAELRSNGVLRAVKKVDIKFEHDGKIEEISLFNGMRVKKGDVLAKQNIDLLLLNKEKERLNLQKAELTKADLLLSLGFTKLDSIPEDIYQMALLRSNVSEIAIQVREAEKREDAAVLRAPFAGRVANVEAQAFSFSSDFEKICTLIDDGKLFVDFKILEEEFGILQKGDPVVVRSSTGSGEEYSGYISQINPLVDENGFITTEALINNTSTNSLIDGMHVNVVIRKKLGKQIVVPKEAIVQRDGKSIAFTYHDDIANWNYLTTGYENKDSICIIDGLEKGDSLIVENNINLTHKIRVKLQ